MRVERRQVKVTNATGYIEYSHPEGKQVKLPYDLGRFWDDKSGIPLNQKMHSVVKELDKEFVNMLNAKSYQQLVKDILDHFVTYYSPDTDMLKNRGIRTEELVDARLMAFYADMERRDKIEFKEVRHEVYS